MFTIKITNEKYADNNLNNQRLYLSFNDRRNTYSVNTINGNCVVTFDPIIQLDGLIYKYNEFMELFNQNDLYVVYSDEPRVLISLNDFYNENL
jgi:hypothetical protein